MDLMASKLDLNQLLNWLSLVTLVLVYYFRSERSLDKRIALVDAAVTRITADVEKLTQSFGGLSDAITDLRVIIAGISPTKRTRRSRSGGRQ